jgi:hypothetical protein
MVLELSPVRKTARKTHACHHFEWRIYMYKGSAMYNQYSLLLDDFPIQVSIHNQ